MSRLSIGLYSPYLGATYGGGEKYLLATAAALHRAWPEHRVEVVGTLPVDRERYRRLLNTDLDGVETRATNRRVTPAHRLLNRLGPLRPLRDRALERQAARAGAAYDLYLPMAYAIPVHGGARQNVVLCQFPYAEPVPAAGEFQAVICQSEYVRGWVRRRWGVDSAVVRPPIDVPGGEPDWEAKERLILSVGRFIGAGHVKRQDLLVRSFRSLCDRGLEGWTLHLAGTVHRDAVHAGFFEAVEELSRGYPVVLHPDAPYEDLQDLYRRAAVYWHAAGAGVDEGARPEALEHFGMTTVEAMGHGAVPVVYGRGGPAEVVEDGVNGCTWLEAAGLEAATGRLVAEPALRRRLGEAARASSLRYGRARFDAEMVDLLAPRIRDLER